MQYRGGMLPDQWPTEVQRDIAAVKDAVAGVSVVLLGEIAADIDAVRLAVQATTNALLGEIAADIDAVRASVAKVETATETVRAALLGEIETSLITVRRAVNAGPGGDVWFPTYRVPPAGTQVPSWYTVSSLGSFTPRTGQQADYTQVDLYVGPQTRGALTRFVPWSAVAFAKLLRDSGRTVIPVPDPLPPAAPGRMRALWERARRALWRSNGPYRDRARVTG